MQKLFGHIIKVYAGKYPNSDIIEVYKWQGYKFEQFIKWQWYFEYRAALLRVKYPKNHIYSMQFDEPLTKKTSLEILNSNISSQRGQVTKIKNAIYDFQKNWDELFPIESHPLYTKALKKLNEAENKLESLIKQKQHYGKED